MPKDEDPRTWCLHLFAPVCIRGALDTCETTELRIPIHPVATPTMPPAPEVDKRQAAREVIDILHEIATLLVCPPSSSCALTRLPSHLNRSRRYATKNRELTIL